MNHYEIVCMIHPDKIDKIETIINQYKNIILDNTGIIHRVEDWGRRQLAYPIANLHKAHYFLMNFSCNNTALKKLNYDLEYNDAVLKRLLIRTKNIISDISIIMKNYNDSKLEGIKHEK